MKPAPQKNLWRNLKTSLLVWAMLFGLLAFTVSPVAVSALTREQKKLLDSGIYYFDAESGISACSSSTGTRGSQNAERIFNFFLDKGLSAAQAAGAYGNIMHESSGDPENIQNPAGRTRDPAPLTADTQGWGLIQWTPGAKIINLAKEAGITTPLYELPTQLELVWQHMNNNPVVTQPFDLAYYKTITDYKVATAYFEDKIEGAGVVALDNRQLLALDGIERYGKGAAAVGGASGSTVCGESSSGEVVGSYSLPLAKKWYASNKEWFTKDHHDYPAADIPVPDKSPVYAMADGKIISAPVGGGCGNGIIIETADKTQFIYCHGADGGSFAGAKNGDSVKAGQQIMRTGYTGTVRPPGLAGSHLHLQIKVGGNNVCPQSLFVGIAEGNVPDINNLPRSGCTYGTGGE